MLRGDQHHLGAGQAAKSILQLLCGIAARSSGTAAGCGGQRCDLQTARRL